MDAGVGHVIVETDTENVVQAVYSCAFDLIVVTNLIVELRILLALNFISWKLQHHPRRYNRVAHNLAVFGSLCNPVEVTTLTSILVHIQLVIADDSASAE